VADPVPVGSNTAKIAHVLVPGGLLARGTAKITHMSGLVGVDHHLSRGLDKLDHRFPGLDSTGSDHGYLTSS
jgi:hypothetical protein